MNIRLVEPRDRQRWLEMRSALWPDRDRAELAAEQTWLFELDPPYTVFVAEDDGDLIGFIELWERSYAEGGPPRPSAYVEGLFVDPRHRRRNVARKMLQTAEGWARSKGYAWLGSDAEIANEVSRSWHLASGFAEIERLVVFGKPLG